MTDFLAKKVERTNEMIFEIFFHFSFFVEQKKWTERIIFFFCPKNQKFISNFEILGDSICFSGMEIMME